VSVTEVVRQYRSVVAHRTAQSIQPYINKATSPSGRPCRDSDYSEAAGYLFVLSSECQSTPPLYDVFDKQIVLPTVSQGSVTNLF
jgi:hypothetical protein